MSYVCFSSSVSTFTSICSLTFYAQQQFSLLYLTTHLSSNSDRSSSPAIDTVEMGDRIERLVLLPFSFGCVSEASVVVAIPHPRRSRSDTNSPAAATRGPKGDKDVSEGLSGESMRNLLRLHEDVPKSNSSLSFNRLLKGFKNIPQLFVNKEELEEVEMDMEIGCPTNVQHVTHIGWDGFAGTETATSSHSLSIPSQHSKLSNLKPKPGTSS